MKNRIFTFFLSMIVFTLVACQEEKETYKIGVSQCSDDLWRETMNKELMFAASLHSNIAIEIRNVSDDTEAQIEDIKYFINNKVDLLVVSPNEAKGLSQIIQTAYQMGIHVILVDRKIETEDYTTYIGADNYLIGKKIGEYVGDVLNGKGNVVEMRGLEGSTSDSERHAGFMDGLQNYPEIKIIAEGWGNFLKYDAHKEMERILKEDKGSIDLVFAMNDEMAVGVSEAAMILNRRPPYIIGIDALSVPYGGVQNIINGLEDASFLYPTGGDKVIQLAMNILKGNKVPRENTLVTALVDKSNAHVIQLQTEQIYQRQEKLENINHLLNDRMKQYATQETLFLASILLVALLLILLSVSFWAYRNKSKLNSQLQNQKEQLLILSEQLKEATHEKLVFFTNISHELKTPLTLILGPIKFLQSIGNNTNEQTKMLNIIDLNSKRLLALISQIIEFRTYENKKMQTFFEKADLKSFLEELNLIFEDYIDQKQVKFKFVSSNTPFEMCFDKEKVETMYFNLLSNSFKHVKKEGKIEIEISKVEKEELEYGCIKIFNEGKLIPQDKLSDIFKRFYKVNYHDTGTGIGLALVSSLVEMHNGWIEVQSEGLGTTFSVYLPIKQTISEIILTEENSRNPVPLELLEHRAKETQRGLETKTDDKPIILLIEDNASMRDYISLTLSNDYTVIEEEDGAKGIQQVIKHIPDIIICDVMMPEMDGFEVCKILKENILTCHIPIILLTACSLDEQRAEGYNSGADAYICKPFNADLLKIRIHKLIENRSKMQEIFSMSFVNDNKIASIADNERLFIEKFKENIIQNISEPTLNVESLAKEMGFSRVQLYRKIKSATTYSPNELIRIIRLKHSLQLLSTGMTISEVAYSTGFSTSSYFTKCFKDFYKKNPSEYLDLI